MVWQRRLVPAAVPLLALAGVLLSASASLAAIMNDADGDGCSDGEELWPDPRQGGLRDPDNFWDFFDTPDGANGRDGAISVSDIARVVQRFGRSGSKALDPLSAPPAAPAYHTAFDRTSPGQAPNGREQGPDGLVSVQDIALSVAQFGHSCAGPEVLGTWSDGPPMPTARTEVTAATLNGVIYVIGGFLGNGTHTGLVEAYDTATDAWLDPAPAPLPQALDHAGAATIDGKLYVVGGYINLFQGTISPTTYEYDPVANDWTERAPMPLPRAAAATVALDGKVYVLGGVGPQPAVPLAYDPATNMWSQFASMSAAREHLTASVANGKIYVIGGRQNVVQNVNTAAAYDPATNSWQPLAALPTARGGLASGVLSARVHVVGGENLLPGGGTYPQHEVYDPSSNAWRPAPPLPTPRHGLAAQVVDGRLYVIGGGPAPNLSVSSAVEIFELKP